MIERRQQVNPENSLFEDLIGYVLLGGVMLSVMLIVGGSIWQYALTGSSRLGTSLVASNLGRFWVADLKDLFNRVPRPPALMNVGIAVLMTTPFLRIFASILYFALVEKNLKYTLFTFFVFAVLGYSIL